MRVIREGTSQSDHLPLLTKQLNLFVLQLTGALPVPPIGFDQDQVGYRLEQEIRGPIAAGDCFERRELWPRGVEIALRHIERGEEETRPVCCLPVWSPAWIVIGSSDLRGFPKRDERVLMPGQAGQTTADAVECGSQG